MCFLASEFYHAQVEATKHDPVLDSYTAGMRYRLDMICSQEIYNESTVWIDCQRSRWIPFQPVYKEVKHGVSEESEYPSAHHTPALTAQAEAER